MRPRLVSDEAILDAARACLLEHGSACSVATIGQRLGISGPAVLKRFGTRENLVTRALISEALSDLSVAPEPGPLRPQLIALLLHTQRLLLQAAPRLATLRAGGIVASRMWAKDHPRAARRRLFTWLEVARRTHGLVHADLETAADLLISLVEARGFLSWVEPTWVDAGDQWAANAADALFGRSLRSARATAPARVRATVQTRRRTSPRSRTRR